MKLYLIDNLTYPLWSKCCTFVKTSRILRIRPKVSSIRLIFSLQPEPFKTRRNPVTITAAGTATVLPIINATPPPPISPPPITSFNDFPSVFPFWGPASRSKPVASRSLLDKKRAWRIESTRFKAL